MSELLGDEADWSDEKDFSQWQENDTQNDTQSDILLFLSTEERNTHDSEDLPTLISISENIEIWGLMFQWPTGQELLKRAVSENNKELIDKIVRYSALFRPLCKATEDDRPESNAEKIIKISLLPESILDFLSKNSRRIENLLQKEKPLDAILQLTATEDQAANSKLLDLMSEFHPNQSVTLMLRMIQKKIPNIDLNKILFIDQNDEAFADICSLDVTKEIFIRFCHLPLEMLIEFLQYHTRFSFDQGKHWGDDLDNYERGCLELILGISRHEFDEIIAQKTATEQVVYKNYILRHYKQIMYMKDNGIEILLKASNSCIKHLLERYQAIELMLALDSDEVVQIINNSLSDEKKMLFVLRNCTSLIKLFQNGIKLDLMDEIYSRNLSCEDFVDGYVQAKKYFQPSTGFFLKLHCFLMSYNIDKLNEIISYISDQNRDFFSKFISWISIITHEYKYNSDSKYSFYFMKFLLEHGVFNQPEILNIFRTKPDNYLFFDNLYNGPCRPRGFQENISMHPLNYLILLPFTFFRFYLNNFDYVTDLLKEKEISPQDLKQIGQKNCKDLQLLLDPTFRKSKVYNALDYSVSAFIRLSLQKPHIISCIKKNEDIIKEALQSGVCLKQLAQFDNFRGDDNITKLKQLARQNRLYATAIMRAILGPKYEYIGSFLYLREAVILKSVNKKSGAVTPTKMWTMRGVR